MKPPADDLADRQPIWNVMQMFWMDTDPNLVIPHASQLCANSKYDREELEEIFWNEVFPAVRFNLLDLPAPEWCGFDLHWLTNRILDTNRYGKKLPRKWLHQYSDLWWKRLDRAITTIRERGISQKGEPYS